MVLVLENVGKDFIAAFWKFIKDGGYKFASRKNAEGEVKYVFDLRYFQGRSGPFRMTASLLPAPLTNQLTEKE